jgi:hypothetical protein
LISDTERLNEDDLATHGGEEMRSNYEVGKVKDRGLEKESRVAKG